MDTDQQSPFLPVVAGFQRLQDYRLQDQQELLYNLVKLRIFFFCQRHRSDNFPSSGQVPALSLMQLARQQFGGLVMPYVVVRRAEDQAKGGFFKGLKKGG